MNDFLVVDNTVVFLDAPGTVVDVPAGQGVAQAGVLNNLCGAGSLATCSFDAKRQVDALTPIHPVGDAIRNTSGTQARSVITVTDTVTNTTNFEISAKAKFTLFEIIETEIMTKYGRTWTDTHTFTQALNIMVPARTEYSVTAEQPVFRVFGDFTVVADNTTSSA